MKPFSGSLDPEKRYRLFGYADGSYTSKCLICKKEFMGDKRAYTCLDCAKEFEVIQAKVKS